MRVTEIFFSIQGESSHAGKPCIFVRLTGCSLRCVYCDTKYSYAGGHEMTMAEVLSSVESYPAKLVELTGGEPLEQEEAYPLMDSLLERGYTVMLETGGHLSIADVPPGVIRIVDVKCPASGESAKNHWANLDLLTKADEVKFVIQDRADYEFARGVVAAHDLVERTGAVLFSPVHGGLPAKELAAWILADKLKVRLQLQAHKYIWGADVRGV